MIKFLYSDLVVYFGECRAKYIHDLFLNGQIISMDDLLNVIDGKVCRK